jgi:hypothetical protein
MEQENISLSIQDAYTLIGFASSHGIDLDVKDIGIIVLTRKNFANLTEQQEIDFWTSYKSVTKQMNLIPITLESIKDKKNCFKNISIYGKNYTIPLSSAAKRSAIYYTIITIIFLMSFLLVQIFNLKTKTVTDELDKAHAEYNILPKTTDTDVSAAKKNEKLEKIDAYIKLLNNIVESWSKNDGFISHVFNIYKNQNEKNVGNNNADDELSNALNIQLQIRFIQNILNSYIIPLICGVLGVCAYIIRELTQEIKNYTFTSESRISFRLRLALGSLIGIFAGFLLVPASGKVVDVPSAAFSSIALPFIFGYSIEAFFVVLENLLAYVSKPTK